MRLPHLLQLIDAELRVVLEPLFLELPTEGGDRLIVELGAAGVAGHSPNSDVLIATTRNLKQHLRYIGFLTDYRRWLAGDAMSFADLAAAGHVSCLDYLGVINWDLHPSTRDWYMRLKSRRSFAGILDDRLPGLSPPPHYDDPDF